MKGRSLYVEVNIRLLHLGRYQSLMHASRMLFTASKHFCALSANVLALWTERGLYRDCHQGMTKGFVYMCDGERDIL